MVLNASLLCIKRRIEGKCSSELGTVLRTVFRRVSVLPSFKSNDVYIANTSFSNLEDEIIHSAPVNLMNRAKLLLNAVVTHI